MYKIIPFLFLIISSCTGQILDINQIKNDYSKGNYNEVIKSCSIGLTKIDKSDTLFKTLIKYRVGSYMRLTNYKSAIEDYKILIEIDKNEISNYTGISYAYWEVGDTINGLNYSEKAFLINPKDTLTLSNLSYDFSLAKKFNKSIEYATKGLELNPDKKLKGLLLNNRGFSYLGLKQYDMALKDINESISFFPDNSFAYYYRALVNIEIGKIEFVCDDLFKSKQLGGNNMTDSLIGKYCKKK
ncbi:MAG: hypothetical protein A2033_10170 [Bacteroidetes bacterium GWA2_31_9]|nr:MAG: hypothetical protein A2033_10170 [Bacteroidetes bacterium GWA2_31_9]